MCSIDSFTTKINKCILCICKKTKKMHFLNPEFSYITIELFHSRNIFILSFFIMFVRPYKDKRILLTLTEKVHYISKYILLVCICKRPTNRKSLINTIYFYFY